MKILMVCQYYYPEQFLINDIVPELTRRGHTVTVLTGLPNYPKGEIFEGYESKSRRYEMIDGISVIRCYERPRKTGPINLMINYISFCISATLKAKRMKDRFDVVVCYQLSPVTMLMPAIAYAKKNQVPLLTYCLDIWPESAKDQLNIPLLYRIIGLISKKLYSYSNHIAVTSRPFIDYLETINGYPRNQISYLPQHAEDIMLKDCLEAEDNGIIDFMYAGNMGKGQWLEIIIKAVAELKDEPGFIVHMVGDGSQRKKLQNLADSLGVTDKVIFWGFQQRADMHIYYKKADALLLTLRGDNKVGSTMPSKLQFYMATGKPIFGAVSGAAKEVISEAHCGVVADAGEYKELANIMKKYIEHPEDFNECGNNARKYYSTHFTKEIFMDSLVALLNKMVEL